MEMFANREAAMFRGTPSVMEALKTMTDDELVRLPYFSQTSDESWIYTYPSLNISMNSSLKENDEKLAAAMKVMECFLSPEGQKYIACGEGMISYNDGVESDMTELTGSDIRALVEAYLQDTGTNFHVTDKYELPVASEMKLILAEEENGYQLNDIEVDGESIKFR